MDALTVPDDDGYVTLRVRTAEGQPPADLKFDLYELEEAIRGIARQHGDDLAALYSALKGYFEGLNLPTMSRRAAFRLALDLRRKAEALRGKDRAGETSTSPG